MNNYQKVVSPNVEDLIKSNYRLVKKLRGTFMEEFNQLLILKI